MTGEIEEEGVCQVVEAAPFKTQPCIPGTRLGFPLPPTTQPCSLTHSPPSLQARMNSPPFLFRRGKYHRSVKRGKLEQGLMQAGEKRRRNFHHPARLCRKRIFWGALLLSLALEGRGEARAPILSPGVRLHWGLGQHSRIIPFRNWEA